MRNRIGDPVTLWADTWHGSNPGPGDVLRTVGGSWYRIIGVRPRRRVLNGFRLDCVRISPGDIDAGDTVFDWTWARRRRARR